MKLYARSEIDFAAMVSRSTNDAARAVVADCETFVAKVQSDSEMFVLSAALATLMSEPPSVFAALCRAW